MTPRTRIRVVSNNVPLLRPDPRAQNLQLNAQDLLLSQKILSH
jgi:hypothetical protein